MSMWRAGGHPFKRTCRRQVILSLFVLITGIRAFVPSLQIRTAAVHPKSPFVQTTSLSKVWRYGHWDHGSSVGANADASGEDRSGDGRSYRISGDQLERIKESVDIVSVIESYDLPGFQRQGDNRAKALCPFHDDHNPSLNVDGKRGIYKCFACGAGGDVFRFVREYSTLKGGEPMTFYQAVRHVATEFGDPNLQLDFVSSSSKPSMSEEERKVLNEKKQRLLLANAAAAAFYGKCLVTVPAAGAARAHLQRRSLSPATVQTFAMGYAPDAYFRVKGQWGVGSLVHHLRDLGFKPSEIIEAGLATRTKGGQHKSTVEKQEGTEVQEDDLDDDYDTLIDRFRNRLVVPIFDAIGTHVIGFGGRVLPPEENISDASDYKAPKYINSPESLVFKKKNVLFGQHYASQSILETKKKDTPNRGSLVVVEGYMDAIALWEAGVHEVVASMGTSLTIEQLANAARTAGTRGGQVILCLDNDEAGINAIERLCTGSILLKTTEVYVVEVLVATLPKGIKDPAEFIESKAKGSMPKAGDAFRKEVLDTAKDWTAWYIDRLLSKYDPRAIRGTAGTFADICDRVSDFLSRFPNPAERTKRAHDVAGTVADIVSSKSGSGEVSNALRIQLETDLVNMVSRKAGARESIERRIESVEGISPDVTKQKLAQMIKGDGTGQPNHSLKLSSRALRAANRAEVPTQSQSKVDRAETHKASRKGQHGRIGGPANGRRGERRRMWRSQKKPFKPPLTPHFSGFDFENQSDADWLDLPREKWKRRKSDLTLGFAKGKDLAKVVAARMGDDYVPGLILNEAVYFNSDHYHGHQFLTQEAMEAGYSNGDVAHDTAAILEQGVASLIRQDADALVSAAEEKLLGNLVRSNRARRAIINSLATSEATGSHCTIEWSSADRAWLFDRLVEHPTTIPEDFLAEGRMQDLRSYLAELPDCPDGVFAKDSVTLDYDCDNGSGDKVEMMPQKKSQGSQDSSPSSDVTVDSNTPSDSQDIEDWAASYDPSMFELPSVNGEEEDPTVVDVSEPQEVEVQVVSTDDGSPGSLDLFFASEEDLLATTYDESVSRELRTELEVQEAHAMLLRASALKQLASVNQEWLAAGGVLAARLEDVNALDDTQKPSSDKLEGHPDGVIEFDDLHLDSLKDHCNALAKKLRDLAETAHQLDVSARRIGSRLLDYSNADGVEGRLSVAKQEELAAMVDDYVNELPDNWQAPFTDDDTGRFHNNRDPVSGWGDEYGLDRNESFERDMEQITEDWGQWADDDYTWTPEDNRDSSRLSHRASGVLDSSFDFFEPETHSSAEEEDEPLDDALQRLDAEWGDWDNEDVDVRLPVTSTSDSNEVDLSDDQHNSALSERDCDSFEGHDDGELEDPDFDSVFE